MARGPITISTDFKNVGFSLCAALLQEGKLEDLRGAMRGWELAKGGSPTDKWPAEARMLWQAMWDAINDNEEDEEQSNATQS